MNGFNFALEKIVHYLSLLNAGVLWVGRQASWVLVILMVTAILLQVFFRYVLNNALPWPEEAARAAMIWMMALTAPSAYRWGGFVSINMVAEALPPILHRILTTLTFALAGIVLIVLLEQAIKHFNSGFIFRSSTLKIHLAWIYLSMSVCLTLLISVNLELLLRSIGQITGDTSRFPYPKQHEEQPVEE